MTFVDHDYVIETFATNRADHALCVRVLPGRAWSNDNLLDTHVLDALPEVVAVDRIPIADQEPWRLVLGKRFDDRLSRPLGRWVRGDVEVNDATSIVAKHHEGEKYAERRRWNCEEVNCNDVSNMLVGVLTVCNPDWGLWRERFDLT